MKTTFLWLTLTLTALVPAILDSTIKGTLLLVLAGVCLLALRRGSASTRHLVLVSSFAAMLLLPVLSMILPKWRVLPGWIEGNGSVAMVGTGDSRLLYDLEPSSVVAAPVESAVLNSRGAIRTEDRRKWLGAIWCAGFVVFTGRMLLGGWRLRKRGRAGRSCGEEISGTAVALSASLGLRRKVRVLLGTERCMPMTWGTLKPVILLPAEAPEWNPTRRRSVLLHELAHVKRRDTAIQAMVRFACALHWFNPLVWIAARRIELERERACDDLVLAHGVRASDYAENLLRIVTGCSSAAKPLAGLAMARVSTLEERLAAILNERLNRRRLTRGMMAVLAVSCLAVVLPMAMLDAADEGIVDAAESPAEEDGALHSQLEDVDLKKSSAANGDVAVPVAALRAQCDALIAERDRLLQYYTQRSPLVLKIEGRIAELEARIVVLRADEDARELGVAPADLNRPLQENAFAGIGVALTLRDDGYPAIGKIIEGSAAEKVGTLREGDEIRALRTGDSEEWTDLQHMRLEWVVKLIRGEPGTTIRLRVARDGGTVIEQDIERQTMILPEPDAGNVEIPVEAVAITETVALQFAAAEDVAAAIRALETDAVRAIAEVRTNRLILNGPPDALAPIRQLIKELDRPGPDAPAPLTITLHASGEEDKSWVEIGGASVTQAELRTRLKALKPRPDQAIIVADKETPMKTVMETLESLRDAGIDSVSFAPKKAVAPAN